MFLATDKLNLTVDANGAWGEPLWAAEASTRRAYVLRLGRAGVSAGPDDAQGPDTVREPRGATSTQPIGPATDNPLPPFVDPLGALAAPLRSVSATS